MTRRWPPIRRLASVAAGALVLSGCAQPPVDLPSTTARPAIAVRPGRPGLVVAAPAGRGDLPTDAMAGEIARRTGFGLVVASASEPGRGDAAYEQRVLETAQGPLRFYAEIHGGERRGCEGRLDIGTVGVDAEQALRLRALAELIRDAHLRANREVQRLDVQVEPAARDGVLRWPQRALQIELPRCPRRDWRDTYTAILADFLAQAVTLPPGR
jgi:hypothetical protein